MPRKMVYIGTSGTIPFTMNTLMPTGGLSSPIWMISTATTPNQTRSTPSSVPFSQALARMVSKARANAPCGSSASVLARQATKPSGRISAAPEPDNP
jgi:hypothetical protein